MPQPAPTSPAHRPTRRWRMLIPLLLSVSMIVIGDRLLRARENLVGTLAAKDARVLIPFSDYLTERIEKKNTWNSLHQQIAAARATNDQKGFVSASYALAQFISEQI